MTLGSKVLVNIVFVYNHDDFLAQWSKVIPSAREGLFKHALGTAMLSQRFWQKFTGKAHADIAYTAGLSTTSEGCLGSASECPVPAFLPGDSLEGRNDSVGKKRCLASVIPGWQQAGSKMVVS